MTTHATHAAHGEAGGHVRQLVTVRIGGQLFGLSIDAVNEVFSPEGVTRVPLAAPEIDGVLNLRGRIVTMIDMREMLKLRSEQPAVMAVGIESVGDAFGLMIDDVGDVLILDDAERDPNPSNLDPHWARFVDGVYRLPSELLLLLDVERVLAGVGHGA
ncbi:chemotaxis protein CheW [Starkeya koreensis]|uniref:Chemotaxis protein CheW n=1 Tax=Ancylobacter koreensis TaxID=266121 RepID=A0ABT0DKX7_9HYPH|nr:chemotaxis protein CheW [Ancylobacter koreensis]MCK0207936.1 chemotaxis protein CheW [Ancylobacter koreensis]